MQETVILAPMLALMILIGVHPTPLLRRMEPSVQAVLARVYERSPASSGVTISAGEPSSAIGSDSGSGSGPVADVDETGSADGAGE